ncbi:MAG: hypothetical protein HQK81_08645 [Desulfovibrionaceae bacterium]|nr:hypothetical protein [Desulfovibrionaceae bacterium]MBF0514117.1 hypothetical protein [Desulfovibrionaceae bacterium]
MKTTADYLDALAVETLADMADGFFSRRKSLDDAVDVFNAQAREVKAKAENVLCIWRSLRRLLFGVDGSGEFARLAGLAEAGFFSRAEDGGPPWRFKPPFALTAKARYRNSLLLCYRALATAAKEYREGVYVPDARDPKRKRLTPNYDGLTEMGRKLAAEIDAVNNSQPAYCLIGFAKSLNPAEIQRERVTGATLGNMQDKVNEEMAYGQICFDGLCVPEIPLLPPPESMRGELMALAGRLYRGHADQAAAAIKSLAPE